MDLTCLQALGLNWALALVVNFLQIQLALRLYNNKHLAHNQPESITPVDPAGPHCYRNGTKTC